MNEDGPAASADQPSVGPSGGLVRGEWRGGILIVGIIAGLSVGCLDLLGAANGGKLERCFDFVDAPVIRLADGIKERFHFLAVITPHVHDPYTSAVIVCYWAIIGLIAASFFCVVRASIVNGLTWRRSLVFGVVAGMAAGGLNLAAAVHRWKIEYSFEVIDSPLISAFPPPEYRRLFPGLTMVGHSFVVDVPYLRLAIFCYWTVIGLFLASLYYLCRAGVLSEIIRERTCMRALFLGASAGIFIGALNSLAIANGWELERLFDVLGRPDSGIKNSLKLYHFVNLLPIRPAAGYVCSMVAAIAYWAVIGFFLVSLLCVIQVLVKRKAARETGVSEE